MGSLEDEVRREIEEEDMRRRAQVRYFNVSDHPALSEFQELLRKHKVPPVRFYKNIRSGTSLFGLGPPFTVFSAESEGCSLKVTSHIVTAPRPHVLHLQQPEKCILTQNLDGIVPHYTRGISSDDTIAVRGDLRFVSLAKARRCTSRTGTRVSSADSKETICVPLFVKCLNIG